MIPRHRITRRAEQLDRRDVIQGVVLALLTVGAVSTLLVANLVPRVYEYHEGAVSQANIKSPKKLTFVSQVRTKAECERAAAAVGEFS